MKEARPASKPVCLSVAVQTTVFETQSLLEN